MVVVVVEVVVVVSVVVVVAVVGGSGISSGGGGGSSSSSSSCSSWSITVQHSILYSAHDTKWRTPSRSTLALTRRFLLPLYPRKCHFIHTTPTAGHFNENCRR